MVKNDLVLSRKRASHVVSAFIIFCFLSFVVGYFLGKKKAVQDLLAEETRSMFDTPIYNALHVQEADTQAHQYAEKEAVVTQEPKGGTEYAQARLVSFSSLLAAQQFVNTLQRNGINTTIIKRTGATPKGRRVTWYQVVTDTYTKEQLNTVISAIKQIVKLNEIQIVRVHNDSISSKGNEKQII
ncbi:MAG: hypothetical protein AB7R69_05410 [Candidatus Babeliales bacterium]